jgi:hypothetical protein
MANQLQKMDLKEIVPAHKRPKVQRLVVEGVMEGRSIAQMSRSLERKDKARYRKWHKILVQTMLMPEVTQQIHGTAMAYALQDLPEVVAAVGRRGKTGRMDAARWLGEVTGFHNPRVRHEHSGEITIKMDMPRPVREENVIDAAVVEDD